MKRYIPLRSPAGAVDNSPGRKPWEKDHENTKPRRSERTSPPNRRFRFAPAWIVVTLAASVVLLGAALALIPARAADLNNNGSKSSVLGRVVPLPGTVVDIVSPATGRILSPRERPYSIGDTVKKGDPVAIIEHRYNLHDASHLSTIRWDLLSVMLEARVAALNAKVAREKAERLLALGSASGQEVQSLKAAEEAARAEYLKRKALLDQADAQMQGAELVRKGIFSPIDGTVSSVTVTQGQTINEGVVLMRIVSRKEVGFAARFPESDFRRWDSKSQARVHFDALPDKIFSARAEVISPAVDLQARTRDVIFRVQNVGELLRYGMTGWLETEAK